MKKFIFIFIATLALSSCYNKEYCASICSDIAKIEHQKSMLAIEDSCATASAYEAYDNYVGYPNRRTYGVEKYHYQYKYWRNQSDNVTAKISELDAKQKEKIQLLRKERYPYEKKGLGASQFFYDMSHNTYVRVVDNTRKLKPKSKL